MRLFQCQSCGQSVFFENSVCGQCGHALGFAPEKLAMLTLTLENGIATPVKGGKTYRYCENAAHSVCNWLVPEDFDGSFCLACRHNRTIPDLMAPETQLQWQKMELAKHRLFYNLIALGLPLRNINDDPAGGLAFDFLADAPDAGIKILTGHDEGLITINLQEADDAAREKLRAEMHEPYRTLLGHFRHEIGHYYWDILVRDSDRLADCRALFGDDTEDYAAALERHYEQGAPPDWANAYISAYATSHPWEDFAESWAHYLHILDTLETASAFGLGIHPRNTRNEALNADIDFNPYHAESAQKLVEAWLPLTFAVNSLNRSMGQADLYPFVLSEPVIEKLQFIHEIIHHAAQQPTQGGTNEMPTQQAEPNQPPTTPPAPPGPSPIRPPIENPPENTPQPEIPPPDPEPIDLPPPSPPAEPPPLQA